MVFNATFNNITVISWQLGGKGLFFKQHVLVSLHIVKTENLKEEKKNF